MDKYDETNLEVAKTTAALAEHHYMNSRHWGFYKIFSNQIGGSVGVHAELAKLANIVEHVYDKAPDDHIETFIEVVESTHYWWMNKAIKDKKLPTREECLTEIREEITKALS